MYYAVKDGKVNQHESSSSFRTVYSSTTKTIKAVLSPDEKNVLILRADGTVISINTGNHGFRTVYKGLDDEPKFREELDGALKELFTEIKV